jgi:glutaredoxin
VVNAQLARLRHEVGFTYREVNIDAVPALRDEYNDQVPVVFINGRKVFKYRLDEKAFLKRLRSTVREDARWSGESDGG